MDNSSQTLNADQEKAKLDILNFIESKDTFFNVSGGAGTGKTFLINQILNDLIATKKSIHITGCSHTAVGVLNQSIDSPLIEAITIHSLLGLRLIRNNKTGKHNLIRNRGNIFKFTNSIIIIDEASMISKKLFTYIQESLDDPSNKVIFVGDINQLGPVGEDISQVYLNNYPISHLNTSVRNAGSPLLVDLCTKLKHKVITGSNAHIQLPIVDGDTYKELLIKKYKEVKSADNNFLNIISLAYTNERVDETNKFIRKELGFPEEFQKGEILVYNSIPILSDGTVRVANDFKSTTRLYSSQRLIVDECVLIDTPVGQAYRLILLAIDSDFKLYAHTFKLESDRQNYIKKFLLYNSPYHDDSQYNQFVDLRPTMATTVHKSQGNTFDTVFVDLDNINTCKRNKDRLKMIYVACSRASKKLILRSDK